jgi:hypothetical protein
MKTLYTITWYDQKQHYAVVSDPTSLHCLCEYLDKSPNVTQWCVENMGEGEFPFYQEKLWEKLKMNFSEWVF